jgi:hypothetical protein
MTKTNYLLPIILVALLMEKPAASQTTAPGTTFRIDSFSVVKSGALFFNDLFEDGAAPPSAPDLLTGTNTAISYTTNGLFIESGGKVSLNVDNGDDSTTPAGRPARIHSARLLTSTNSTSARNLGPDDTFVVSGVFDLIFPGPNSEAFRVSVSDRTQPQGPDDTTNDVVRVSFERSERERTTCRDPLTLAPVGAVRGELVIRLLSLDFVLNMTTPLDCFKIDLTGNPDQIRLTVAKINAASSEITGWFTYMKQGVDLSTTVFRVTDPIFTGGVLPDGTPFAAEQHTRPQFDAFFVPGTPTPNIVAELTTGSPVSISQTVNTPSTPFNLEFDYLFTTVTGNLTVSLGGVNVHAISAPSATNPNFQKASVSIEGALLNQNGIDLEFSLDGVTGSTIQLDNIVFPGLVNGDFQTGNLTVWHVSTTGTGTVAAMHTPSLVALDIKPGECPNPVSIKKKGVLPAAILGSRSFDVRNIDLTTLRLEGVSPVRTDFEDVSPPFEPFAPKQDAFDCNNFGPDGFEDLTAKFDAQRVIAAIGPVNNGEIRAVSVTATLIDGTPIRGEDVIVIDGR